MEKPQSLQEWRKLIRQQINNVNKTIFASNIIYVSLQTIAKKFGKVRANQVIERMNLKKFGFKEFHIEN